MKNIISVLAVLVFFLVSTSAFAGEGPMKLPEGAKAEAKKHNKEGMKHWGMGHYDVALKHFSAASKVDGSSGEIHFNEAISYDKLNKHGVATKHFGVAHAKAKAKPELEGNKKLLISPILKGHLGM